MRADSRAVIGFLAGAAAGAIAGILFAPDKGTETRKKISKRTTDMGDSLKNKFSEFVDGVKDSYMGSKKNRKMEDVEEKAIPAYSTTKNSDPKSNF